MRELPHGRFTASTDKLQPASSHFIPRKYSFIDTSHGEERGGGKTEPKKTLADIYIHVLSVSIAARHIYSWHRIDEFYRIFGGLFLFWLVRLFFWRIVRDEKMSKTPFDPVESC